MPDTSDSRTPPDVAALAREALKLCKQSSWNRADLERIGELLPQLARAVLDRQGAVVASEQQVVDLLGELDGIARERDSYEYGLPIYADEHYERMRAAVHAFARALTAGAPADDTARLDWLEQNEASIRHHCVSGRQADGSDADAEWWQVDVLDEEGIPDGHAEETLRAAIDAARSVSPAGAQTQEPRDG